MRRVGYLRLKRIDLGRRDDLHDIAREFFTLQCCNLGLRHILGNNHALHCTCRADMTCHSPCIDVVKARNIVFPQKFRQTFLRLPVVWRVAELPDDKSAHKGAAGLHEFLSRAVVPDERIGHREDLPAEGGIGQTLLISCHRRGEYHFTNCSCFAVEQFARIDRTVLQNQFSFHMIMTPSFITIFPSTTVSTALPLSSRPANGECLPRV